MWNERVSVLEMSLDAAVYRRRLSRICQVADSAGTTRAGLRQSAALFQLRIRVNLPSPPLPRSSCPSPLFLFPSHPFPPFILPFPLQSGPLKPARGFGEPCKLPTWIHVVVLCFRDISSICRRIFAKLLSLVHLGREMN